MTDGKKAVFVDQFTQFHDERCWFSSLMGVTVDQAIWRDGNNHSIWELVCHLTYWSEVWLKRFRNEPVGAIPENELTFATDAAQLDAASWHAAVARLNTVLHDWRESLRNSPGSKMDDSVPGSPPDATWWEALSPLAAHNIYHLGQIVYIRKQQGCWTGTKY